MERQLNWLEKEPLPKIRSRFGAIGPRRDSILARFSRAVKIGLQRILAGQSPALTTKIKALKATGMFDLPRPIPAPNATVGSLAALQNLLPL